MRMSLCIILALVQFLSNELNTDICDRFAHVPYDPDSVSDLNCGYSSPVSNKDGLELKCLSSTFALCFWIK